MKLPIETIQEYLRYSPETGEFHWLKRSSDKTKVGARAGRERSHGGYRQVTLLGQTMYEHRLAWFCIHGDIARGQTIDHINGDKGDNRLANLRIASRGENMANVGAKKDNTSGCKNVHWCATKERWIAKVKKNGRSIYVGTFRDFALAVNAATEARASAFGEFASQFGCDAAMVAWPYRGASNG